MQQRMAPVLALAMLAVLLISACAPAATPAPPAPTPTEALPTLDGQSLVETRCSVCHSSALVEEVTMTPVEWEATVERMVEKGAQLDQAEQELVIGYLIETRS